MRNPSAKRNKSRESAPKVAASSIARDVAPEDQARKLLTAWENNHARWLEGPIPAPQNHQESK